MKKEYQDQTGKDHLIGKALVQTGIQEFDSNSFKNENNNKKEDAMTNTGWT